MKSVSFWAAKNIRPARVLLTFSYLLLIGMAFIVSGIFSESEIVLTGYLLPAVIVVYLITAAFYPSKQTKQYKKYYFRKSCDFALIVCSLLMIVCTASVNNNNTGLATGTVASAAIGDPVVNTRKERKQVKKEQIRKIRALYKELKASYKKGPKGTKIFLIIISSLFAAGLLMGVVALSCSLSCSGQGAAAAMVAIFGTGLVIFLLVLLIRLLNKEFNPKIKAAEKQDETKMK